MNTVIFCYGIVGVVSILILIFTLYNLQLLSPSTHLDAFATLTMIAVMIFGLIATIILTVALSAHVLFAIDEEKLIATVITCVSIVVSMLFAILAVVFNWSLQIYISVLTVLLIIVNAINSVIKSEREVNVCVKELSIPRLYVGIAIAVAVAAVIAVLVSSSIVVENMYNFNIA